MLHKCFPRKSILLSILLSLLIIFFTKNVFSFFSNKLRIDNFSKRTHVVHQKCNFNSNIKSPRYPEEYLFSWPFSSSIEDILSSHPYIFSELHMKSHSIGKCLLMPMAITASYVPIFFNWIAHVILQNSTHILDSLLVVAMDDETCGVLSQFTTVVHVCFSKTEVQSLLGLENSTGKKNLFMTRIVVFWLLSIWGFDILHFDVDAVPVKPNFVDLFLRQGADLVAGMGTYPSSAFQVLGATVCMGSFYLRSLTVSKGVLSLFARMRFENSLDDQIKLNNALVAMQLYWKEKGADEEWHGCDKTNQLNIVLLPQSMICRKKCAEYNSLRGTSKDNLFVIHPPSRKTGKSKGNVLQKFHLWNFKYVAFDPITYHTPLRLDLVEFVKQNLII